MGLKRETQEPDVARGTKNGGVDEVVGSRVSLFVKGCQVGGFVNGIRSTIPSLALDTPSVHHADVAFHIRPTTLSHPLPTLSHPPSTLRYHATQCRVVTHVVYHALDKARSGRKNNRHTNKNIHHHQPAVQSPSYTSLAYVL